VPRKPKETTHLRVRVEPPLLGRLEKAREKSGRTLTGEITERLEQSFTREDRRELIEFAVKQIETKLDELLYDLPTGLRELHDDLGRLSLSLRDVERNVDLLRAELRLPPSRTDNVLPNEPKDEDK
jgi:hypothetical protein